MALYERVVGYISNKFMSSKVVTSQFTIKTDVYFMTLLNGSISSMKTLDENRLRNALLQIILKS